MDKKITRRVVLGSAVTALAAGPFVIRVLRKGDASNQHWGEYAKKWEYYFKKVNVSPTFVEPPFDLSCRLKLDNHKTSRYVFLSYGLLDETLRVDDKEPPSYFSAEEGSFSIDVDDNCTGNIYGATSDSQFFSRQKFNMRKNDEWSIALHEGRMTQCSPDFGVAKLLFFGYPNKDKISLGSSWVGEPPFSKSFPIKSIEYKVIEAIKMGEADILRIDANLHVDGKQTEQAKNDLRNKYDKENSNELYTSTAKKDFEKVLDSKITCEVSASYFLDRKTGLVQRCESTISVDTKSAYMPVCTSGTIFQVLDS